MTILEQVQEDVRTAMKAGERERAAALRMVVDALQQDAKLGELVSAAIEETGATEQGQMGQVMSAVMPKVGGRADGKRVSQVVRERLGA